MRLSTFIRENSEAILQEWERFADDLVSAPEGMDTQALRDHAAGMLEFVVDVLESSKTVKDLQGEHASRQSETAAQAHGNDRMQWGFSIGDMAAEFRALRVSVTRLWSEQTSRMSADDLIRFNAAIDEALAESIKTYMNSKKRQTRLLEAMLSWSSDQSMIFSREGNILYANRAAARPYGLEPSELCERSIDDLDRDFAAEVRRQIAHVLETGKEYRGDFTSTMPDGETHVIDYVFAPIRDENGEIDAVAVNSRDITERKELERTLWQHANHDHLTGVPNRRLFFDRLEQDIRLVKRSGELLALLYVDLDKFKDANDRLGHDRGDALLKEAARRIAACTRETDTVARMGGDEFAVILMGAGDERHVEAVTRAILSRLTRPYDLDKHSVFVGGSIGIALYPEHGKTAADLTARADAAMYAAKNSGGERYTFYSVEHDDLRSRRGQLRAVERPPQMH